MKKFFSKNGIWVLAAVTLIAVIMCIVSAVSGGTGFLHNAAGVVASPFRAAGAAVSRWADNIFEHFESVDELKEENAELRRILDEGEDAIIERIAREQDYAKPNERIFIDISGK